MSAAIRRCDLSLPLPKEGRSEANAREARLRGMALASDDIPPRLRRDPLPLEGGKAREGDGVEGKDWP